MDSLAGDDSQQQVSNYRGFIDKAAGELVPDVSGKVAEMTDGVATEHAEEETPGFGMEDTALSKPKKKQEKLCDTLYFNAVVGFFIVMNLIFIGIERDFGAEPALPGETPMQTIKRRIGWYIVEFVFTLIFFVELVIRLRTYKHRYFYSGMNCGDFVIVVISVVDVWILQVVVGGSAQVRIMSMLRIARMARLVRFVRLLRMFQELWLIVSGLMNSMRTLAWVVLLLCLLLYVCAIFLTVDVGLNPAFQDMPMPDGRLWPVDDLFGSVPRSMLTLFQVVTLDSWADDIARPIMTLKPSMGFFFIFIILVGTYGILNIIVGVIVENTLGTASSTDKIVEEEVSASKKLLLSSLRRLFELSDADNSGTISRQELDAALAIPEVLKKFDELHVAVDELEHLFYLMDTTGTNQVKLEDFFTACSQLLRGHTSDDTTRLAMQMESLNRRLDQLDKGLRGIETEVEESKQYTLQFMHEVVPKLIGAAHTSGKASRMASTMSSVG